MEDFMKKKKTEYFIYAVCVVLVVFYLVVLWWGKNPNVGIEYKMYYITHELTDWPGYGNLKYSYGTKEYCCEYKDESGKEVSYKICSRKGKGWQTKERYNGTKNTGKESYIYYIPDAESENTVLSCDITGYEPLNNSTSYIKVYVNDKKVGVIEGKQTALINIGHVSANELLTVKFVSENVTFTLDSISLDSVK